MRGLDGVPDDYVLKRVAALDTWQDNRSDARALGLTRLYTMASYSPFKDGPRDSVWFVGTYGAKCLVSVGYPNEYSELGMRVAPKLSIQVFNRYGPSTYLDANDAVAYKAVAAFVQTSKSRCA